MIPGWMLIVLATVVGAAIGSFLNVCIYRLPREMSVAWPPSSCPHCGQTLAWYENIPIAAYLALGGHCRTCRNRIGVRYPIVEAVTAAMFGIACWYYGPGLLLVSRLALGCALIVLFAVDLEHHLLPNAITLPGIVVGFAFSLFIAPGWVDSLLGIALGGGSLLAMFYGWLWLRGEEALGMGDPKMLAMIGAFVGWRMTLLTLVFASFIGSLIGVALIVTGRGDRKSMVPFGCFLALGAVAAIAAGREILDWYLGTFA
jgi:leader peptidase (prepilin peptidase)/N-methyltransferase